MRLVFTTQNGSNYALQAISSPTQTTWTTLGGVMGSGLTQTNVVTPPSGATINFRLLPNERGGVARVRPRRSAS